MAAGTRGSEIAVLLERIQGGAAAVIDGAAGEAATDLYLERRRVLRRWVPAADNFIISGLNLAAPKRIGTLLAWRTSDEIEISGDLVATYPFSSGLAPRVSSSTAEGGDEIVTPLGEEPILNVSVSFYVPEAAAEPSPEEKAYRVMRAMSPQKNFFFHGRNLSEAWIIGQSTRRAVRQVYGSYGKRAIQPVTMTAL